MATALLYLDDTYLLKTTATVTDAYRAQDGDKSAVILDETIFYPQGGGQPSDVGTIQLSSTGRILKVIFVQKKDEYLKRATVEHILEEQLAAEELEALKGQRVNLEVVEATRRLHARIHSGGHLLDHSAQLLGLPLQGTKGYHFPAGPYVEYRVTDPNFDTSKAAIDAWGLKIAEQSQKIIEAGGAVGISYMEPKEMSQKLIASLPEKVQQASMVRLVSMENCPLPLPCGGTHVSNTSEIGSFSIKKIAFKSGVLRISYLV